MQLECPNVFGGRAGKRLLNKVVEMSNVIGVSINGRLGHVSDLEVFGEPFCDWANAFLVRSHAVNPDGVKKFDELQSGHKREKRKSF